MRLEIMIGNSDTLIHPIKGNRVLIGSSETCDIILPAKNISRKHLIVVAENDHFYVIDQGSTNGSYINEERLIPGRRVEFTSFFPVRLGDDVLISLLSDDEPGGEDQESTLLSPSQPKDGGLLKTDHDSTSVISLKQLKEVKTDHLIKKREERRKQVRKKRTVPPPPPKKKIKIDFIKVGALLLLVSAVYYQFFMNKETESIPVVPQVTKVEPPKPKTPEEEFFLVSNDDLIPREQLVGMTSKMKCVTDVEQYFCQTFTSNLGEPFGAYQVGTMIYILLDTAPHIEATSKMVTFPDPAIETNPERFNTLDQHAKHVVALNFLINVIPQDLRTDLVPGLRLTFSFYRIKDNGPELYFSLAVTPEAIQELRKKIHPEFFQEIRTPGNYISSMAAKYYRLY